MDGGKSSSWPLATSRCSAPMKDKISAAAGSNEMTRGSLERVAAAAPVEGAIVAFEF